MENKITDANGRAQTHPISHTKHHAPPPPATTAPPHLLCISENWFSFHQWVQDGAVGSYWGRVNGNREVEKVSRRNCPV